MNILKLLASESFLTLNKPLARLVGLEAAALFADLASSQVYWDNEKGTQGEYFYRTRTMIEDHTTLSPKLQLKAEKALKKLGIIQVQLKGLPATNHYCIGQQEQLNLLNKISPMGVTRQDQREQLDATNGRTIKNKEIKNTVLKIDNNKEKGEQVPTPPLEDDVIDISLKTEPKEEKKKVPPKKKETAEDAPYYFEVTQVLAALTEKTGAKYRIPTKKSLLLRYGPYQIITARIKEGFVLEDLISVIDSKCKEWLSSEKMCKYLIPSTLFSKSKFESYLASTSIKSTNSTNNGNQHPLITDREMHDKVLTLECTLKNLRIYTNNLDSLKDQEKLDAMQEIYNTHKNKQK